MEPEKHPTQQENKCYPNMPAFASEHSFGLTKREYFAALFLQAMLSNSNKEILEIKDPNFYYFLNEDTNLAVIYADMLIDKLNNSL